MTDTNNDPLNLETDETTEFGAHVVMLLGMDMDKWGAEYGEDGELVLSHPAVGRLHIYSRDRMRHVHSSVYNTRVFTRGDRQQILPMVRQLLTRPMLREASEMEQQAKPSPSYSALQAYMDQMKNMTFQSKLDALRMPNMGPLYPKP